MEEGGRDRRRERKARSGTVSSMQVVVCPLEFIPFPYIISYALLIITTIYIYKLYTIIIFISFYFAFQLCILFILLKK